MRIRDAAIEYAGRGWPVLPVRGKETGLALKEFKPSVNPTEIKQWWTANPTANVAIKTGLESGLIVLDIDPRNGGFSSLALMEELNGKLPNTPRVRSGGGGLHYYFIHPHFEVHGRIGMKPGVDVKAYGGGMIAPPSIHPETNRQYDWEIPHTEKIIPIPYWLLQMIMTKQAKKPDPVKQAIKAQRSPHFNKYKNLYRR